MFWSTQTDFPVVLPDGKKVTLWKEKITESYGRIPAGSIVYTGFPFEDADEAYSAGQKYIRDVIRPERSFATAESSLPWPDCLTFGADDDDDDDVGGYGSDVFCHEFVKDGFSATLRLNVRALQFYVRDKDGAEQWADAFVTELVRHLAGHGVKIG